MKLALVPLALLVFASTVAFAADAPPAKGRAAAACQADVEKFCPGVEPGGHRIADCLKQNKAKLSQACKDAVAQSRAKRMPAPASAAAPKG